MKIDSQSVVTKRIAKILRACRKNLGINQVMLAKELGLEQSALSRVESCKQNLTAQQWFHFCRFVGISPDSLSTGFVEIYRPESEQEVKSGIRLPKKYSELAFSQVRSAQPLIQTFIKKHGEEKFDSYLSSLGLEPEYFVDLNNKISFNFCLDLSRNLLKSKTIERKKMSAVTQYAKSPEIHGSIFSYYDHSAKLGRFQLFQSLLANIKSYGQNFSMNIVDDSAKHFDVAVAPLEHMDAIPYQNDPILGDFLCEYNKSYLKDFLTIENIGSPRIDIIENQYRFSHHEKSVYRIFNE